MIAPFKQRDTDRETWERECVCVWFGWNSVGSTAKTMSMFAIDNKRCSQLLVLQQTIFNWVSNVFLYVFCFRSNWIRRHIRRERKKDKRELNHRFTRIENAPFTAHYFHFAKWWNYIRLFERRDENWLETHSMHQSSFVFIESNSVYLHPN